MRDLSLEVVLYTHQWSDPPGEEPAYRVVTHRRGGVLSAPWDWKKIAGDCGGSFRAHEVLFIHNHPSTLWYLHAGAAGRTPPAVWYCHEPPAALYGESSGPGRREARSWSPSRLLRSLRFYGTDAFWRLYSGSRRRFEIRRTGGAVWQDAMRRLDREAVSSIPWILANSRYTAGRIEEIYSRDSTVVHPIPADLESMYPPPGTTKDPVILWVGRMEPAKRPLLLLDAWCRARRQDERLRAYTLVLIGEGPLRRQVLARIEQLSLQGSVECLRRLPRGEMVDRYRRALVTVHLGLAEPFGLVPLESMAAGTAVLAECQGGVRETVVDGRTGWCALGLDESTLASYLARVPAKRSDLLEMGGRAAEHVRSTFSSQASFETILECLSRAASRERHGPERAPAASEPLRES